MRTLVTDPLIPGPLWAALAVLSLSALAAYLLVRPPRVGPLFRAAIGGLLLVGTAGILAILLNPTWEEFVPSQLARPALDLLVDTSRSMDTCDSGAVSRLQLARDEAQRLREELSQSFNVRLWRFDEELRAVSAEELGSLQSSGTATDLGSSVGKALRSDLEEEAALVVLSDGIHNMPETLQAVTKAARMARAMGVPIFTKTIGADATVADLNLVLATPDDVAFVRQEVPIRVVVEHKGVPRGSTEVTLEADGEQVGSEVVTFVDESPVRAEFPVRRDEPGLYRYVARVTALPQEIVRANNERVFHLRVTDEPIRVLVIEGKPYWDLKFLLRSLAEDPGVSVTGAVRVKDDRVIVRSLAPGEQEGEAGTEQPAEGKVELLKDATSLLASYEALTQYNVVILGRDSEAFLPPKNVENLCRWIGEWGGSLVCARGRPLAVVPERMDAVMPVRWKTGQEVRFRLEMSAEAEFMGWFPKAAALMPSLATAAPVGEVKALATVVARSQGQEPSAGMAAVAYQPYGSGRVVVLEGSGLWRWAFVTAGQEARGELYRRFWNSLLRWLAASADFLPGQTASLRTTQSAYTNLESVVVQLMVRNDPEVTPDSAPSMQVSNAADGSPVSTIAALPSGGAAGVFRASCGPLPIGSYTVRLVRSGSAHAAECAFEVREPVQERLDLRARPDIMRYLAEESAGGAVLSDGPSEQVRSVYMDYWKARHPDEFRRTPAWDRMTFLLAITAVLAAAWVVRRRGGLV